MYLQFLWLLESLSSLLACALHTLGSAVTADSVNSKTATKCIYHKYPQTSDFEVSELQMTDL